MNAQNQPNTSSSENVVEGYQLFESVVGTFILEIEALAETLPLIGELLESKLRASSKKINKFLNENALAQDEEKRKFKIPVDQFNFFNRLDSEYKVSKKGMEILPRYFIVSLVSQYDAYLGELYRIVFKIKPELAFSLEKEFSFQDILKYENLEELKEFVIEKDVENLLRERHHEQLKVLERRITKLTGKDFTLTTNLSILPVFIEVAERRNLFVHTNGIVSRQYIDNCTRFKVEGIKSIKLNDILDAKPAYFEKAYRAYFEIGVKLCQVLWRKFLPSNIVEADKNLNNICYYLLYDGYYDLAKTLLKFATEELPKNGSQEVKKMLVVNKALAFYLSGDKNTCNKIIDAEDFSIGNEFKLAKAILTEDYADAKKFMIKIGSDDESITKEAYQEWPLFKIFRESDVFKDTFKQVFGEDFVIREFSKKSFIKLLDSIQEKQK